MNINTKCQTLAARLLHNFLIPAIALLFAVYLGRKLPWLWQNAVKKTEILQSIGSGYSWVHYFYFTLCLAMVLIAAAWFLIKITTRVYTTEHTLVKSNLFKKTVLQRNDVMMAKLEETNKWRHTGDSSKRYIYSILYFANMIAGVTHNMVFKDANKKHITIRNVNEEKAKAFIKELDLNIYGTRK